MAVLLGSIGALPVGLKGKLYGQPFKVLVQYDAFGGVKAQVYEADGDGRLITEITGRKGEVETESSGFATWAYLRYKKDKKDSYIFSVDNENTKKERESIQKSLRKSTEALVKNLHKEVIDFNKGKDTKTYKPKKAVNVVPRKSIVKKAKAVAKPQYKTINVRDYCVKAHTRRMRIGSPFLY